MATKAELINEIEILKETLKMRENEISVLKKRCNEELPKMFEDRLKEIEEDRYRNWKGQNEAFLSRFMNEYIKENLAIVSKTNYNYGSDPSSTEIELYLGKELISSDYIN